MRWLIQWLLLQGPFAACAAGLLFGSGENTNGKTLPPGVPRFHGVGTSGGGFHTLGLTDPDPPMVVTPPNSKTVTERDLAWLAVEATGSDLQFQWLRNGQDSPDRGFNSRRQSAHGVRGLTFTKHRRFGGHSLLSRLRRRLTSGFSASFSPEGYFARAGAK
jgi:hypothetical protein